MADLNVKAPDPDLPVGLTVGTIPAPDGTRRLLLVFSMPGNTVAVPLRAEQVDEMMGLLRKVRPTLNLRIATPGVPLESNGEGGMRVG